MQQITVKLPDDTAKSLEDIAESQYDRNRSDAIRELLEKGLAADDRITDLERENERLRNEKRALIQDREERTELVEYVERERELDQQRQQRRQAPAWRRAKWWLLGEPPADE